MTMRRFLPVLLLLCAVPAFGAEPTRCYSDPRPPSDFITARVLAANTAETTTAPTLTGRNATRNLVAVLSFTGTTYYYNVGGTAVAPTGDVTDGTASGRNPGVLVLAQGASLSIVSPDTTPTLTVEFYVNCR